VSGAGGPSPVVAPNQPSGGGGTQSVAYDEHLGSGLHGRILWIFPVLLLAAIGVAAGRLRAPHRLPAARE
jgi:hypothetical protein